MKDYTDDIEVLTAAEGVRRRVELYVGPLTNPTLPNLLLREAICCARDEALKGIAQKVEFDLWQDGRARVRDYGPGLPLTMDSNGKRIAETFLTVLYACASAKSTPHVAKSTCDVGLLVLNALSKVLTLRIFAAGQEWRQEYQAGKPITELNVVGGTAEGGTELSFELDNSILPVTEFDLEEFQRWTIANVVGVSFQIHDFRTGKVACFET